MSDKRASGDAVIAEIAARQHGVVSLAQLEAAGLDRDRVSYRVRTNRLHRVYRGVYAVGHAGITRKGRWMAAVLACGRSAGRSGGDGRRGQRHLGRAGSALTEDAGELATVLDHWGAAISHRSAASLWDLLPPEDGPVDVSIEGHGGRARRRGIRLHRTVTLLPQHVTLRDGIPVTDPARTIADLGRSVTASGNGPLSARELRRAIRQANVLGLEIGPEQRRDRTRSDLERSFLRLCHRNGLALPEVNVRIGPHLVDFLWREAGLAVETDSYRYHRGRAAFEDDRARDLYLRGKGFTVIRLGERQLLEEEASVVEVLRAAIASPRLRVGADGNA